MIRPLVSFAVLCVLLAGCGDGAESTAAPATDAAAPPAGIAPRSVTIDGSKVLVWGAGDYGVVLAHGAAFDAASWAPQAQRIAAAGMVAVAVENIAPEAILSAVDFVRTELGAQDIALVGGSAGADAILRAQSSKQVADQLILLSANGVVGGLGTEPKLLIASAEEPLVDVSRELAKAGPGTENEALILPGGAHAQNIFPTQQGERTVLAILARLASFSAA